jgi:A/G-specific adenine glycosylase
VAVVIERYRAFLSRFPTLVSLALAQEQEVLALWSGLGYYRRARMLHKAAQFVASHLKGNLPAKAEELRALPGIGAYTAAAIASIAHDECAAVVDGNVERVLCRLEGWKAPSRESSRKSAGSLRRRIEQRAAQLIDARHPGDFNQAMMELGATVCTPRSPRCLDCPIAEDCKTRGEHKTGPRKPMLSREIAHGLAVRTRTLRRFGAEICEVLLEQRPASLSVMPELWELPALREHRVPDAELRMTVRHAIMQINYYVRVRAVAADDIERLAVSGGERRWVPVAEAAQMALTGLTRKVLKRAHLLPAQVVMK